ncbi:MAG: TetR/AcrR family transcriptional regulator [Bryobacteraceae bacterium]
MQRRIKGKKVTPNWGREDRADHIYRVAAEVMCQKGYEATSMNDIADAVGLTKAGLYHYIRGKEDLLFQIMSYGMDMVDQDVMAPAKQAQGAVERLRTIISRHSKRVLEVGGAVSILLDEMYALTPAHRRAIKGRKRAYFEFIRATLEELSVEGKLRNVTPTVATFCLFGMLSWVSRWYRKDGKLSSEQILNDLLEAALHSVLKESADSSTREVPLPLKRVAR